MISEGSSDTEDWSIDVKNAALHHRKTFVKYIHMIEYIGILNCSNITTFTVFW